MDQPASMSLLCEYCAHFQIQLKEGEGYRRGGTRVKCSYDDDILRVMDFTDLGKVSNVCAA